jgi:predicted phosphodiesterase
MRKVYLIVAFLLLGGLAGLVLWYWRIGAPNQFIADLIPGAAVVQPSVTFAVIGDNEGINPVYENLVTQIAADEDVQFVLHLGDALEHGTLAEWQELQDAHARFGLSVPFYIVPGNHDVADDPNRTTFAKVNSAAWRSVDVGNVHLVLLDNAERKVGFPADELTWLDADLAALQNMKVKDQVTVIAYHRPFAYPLASLLGDDETRTSRLSNEQFLTILAKYPVNHIYAGHVHTAIDYTMVVARDATNKSSATVPVTVSGGGGGELQSAFGGLVKERFHWLKVTVVGTDVQSELKPLHVPTDANVPS